MKKKQKKNEGQEGVSKTQRVPAPAEQIKKTKIWRQVACIVTAVAIAAISFSIGLCVSWFSLDAEMRTLIEIKKKINKEYYEEISNETFYGTLFSAINNDLLDDYSGYMTPEEYAAVTSDLDGNRAGLGLVLSTQTADKKEQMLITRVCGNSPAEKAGLTAGSYIIGFGESAEAIRSSKSFDEFSAFLENYGAGEAFFIRIQEKGAEKTLQISCEEYVENYVLYRNNQKGYSFTTGISCEPIENVNGLNVLDDKTAYIRIVQFTGNTTQAFARAMRIFKEEGKTNLVLWVYESIDAFLKFKWY